MYDLNKLGQRGRLKAMTQGSDLLIQVGKPEAVRLGLETDETNLVAFS